jgi:hypothetical protein
MRLGFSLFQDRENFELFLLDLFGTILKNFRRKAAGSFLPTRKEINMELRASAFDSRVTYNPVPLDLYCVRLIFKNLNMKSSLKRKIILNRPYYELYIYP